MYTMVDRKKLITCKNHFPAHFDGLKVDVDDILTHFIGRSRGVAVQEPFSAATLP